MRQALELREVLQNTTKKATTVRESAFNTEFKELEDPIIETDVLTGRGRPRSRKKASTNSIEEEASSFKEAEEQMPSLWLRDIIICGTSRADDSG